jgi:hypothetical protein
MMLANIRKLIAFRQAGNFANSEMDVLWCMAVVLGSSPPGQIIKPGRQLAMGRWSGLTHESLHAAADNAGIWTSDDEIDQAIVGVQRWHTNNGVQLPSGAYFGKIMKVSSAERDAAGCWMIAAVDETAEQRKIRRNREKAEKKRLSSNQVPRSVYLSTSTSTLKPWALVPCGKSTYYKLPKQRQDELKQQALSMVGQVGDVHSHYTSGGDQLVQIDGGAEVGLAREERAAGGANLISEGNSSPSRPGEEAAREAIEKGASGPGAACSSGEGAARVMRASQRDLAGPEMVETIYRRGPTPKPNLAALSGTNTRLQPIRTSRIQRERSHPRRAHMTANEHNEFAAEFTAMTMRQFIKSGLPLNSLARAMICMGAGFLVETTDPGIVAEDLRDLADQLEAHGNLAQPSPFPPKPS